MGLDYHVRIEHYTPERYAIRKDTLGSMYMIAAHDFIQDACLLLKVEHNELWHVNPSLLLMATEKFTEKAAMQVLRAKGFCANSPFLRVKPMLRLIHQS